MSLERLVIMCSQEPGSNVLHGRHRQTALMEIMNKFGDQMTIENGYGGALGVKSPPICSRKIHQILQQLPLLGGLGRLVVHAEEL